MTTYLFEEMEIAEGSLVGMYTVEVEAEIEDGYDSETGCGGWSITDMNIISVSKWNDELQKDEVVELTKEVIDFFENEISGSREEENMIEYIKEHSNPDEDEDEDWTNSRIEDYGL